MIMKWRPGTSHQLPDALSRLLRPGAAGDSIDDSFPDDTPSGNPTDYVGPRGPFLDGQLLNHLEPFKEGVVDSGGVREKHVVREKSLTSPRTPSMLSAIVDSIPRAVAALDPLPGQCDDLTSGAQLATLLFHDRLATVEADGVVLPVRRSSRARALYVSFMPLPEAPARSHCPVRDVHSPSKSRTFEKSAALDKGSVPGALQVSSARPQPGVGDGPATDLVEDVPVARGEESARSTEPTETTLTERAIRSLQGMLRLVGMQEADPFLNKVRQAMFGQGEIARTNGLTKEVVNRYLIDDQSLLWLEME